MMNKKSQTKLGIIFLVLIGMFSLYFVFAGTTNYKTYDKSEKIVSIFSQNDVLLADIQLITPVNFLVPRGYQKVAEFKITNAQDSSLLYDQMKFYNVKDSMKEIDRTFDFKILEKIFVSVDDYGLVNVSLGKIKKTNFSTEGVFGNATNMTGTFTNYYNETGELACQEDSVGNLYGCDYITPDKQMWKEEIGKLGTTHQEIQKKWSQFDKLKDKELIESGNYIIGIFTDVQKGDKVEWIPTFLGVEINDWAIWTESLNVGLIRAFDLKEQGGVVAVDSSGQGNGTHTGSPISISTKMDYGYNYTEVGTYTSETIPATDELTLVIGYKAPTTSINQFLSSCGEMKADTGGLVRFQMSSDGYQLHNTNQSVIANDWNLIIWRVNKATPYNSIHVNNELAWLGNTLYNGAQTNPTFPRTNAEVVDQEFDFVYIWNRTISDEEVNQLWNDGNWMIYTETVPNIAPTSTLNNPTDNQNFTTSSVTFSITPTDPEDLTGLGVNLYENGTSAWNLNSSNASAYNNTQTNFTIAGIPDGLWIWNAEVNDTEGNSSFADSNFTFRVDTTSPIITLPVYSNATMKKNTDTLTLNISVSDSNSGLIGSACKIDINGTNQTIVVSSGWCNTTNGNLTNLADGLRVINVYANDTLNNLALNNSFYVNIDTTIPQIQIISPINMTNSTNYDLPVNYTFSDTNVDSCWWTDDEGATNQSIASCGTNLSGAWVENLNVVRIWINDSANNQNSSEIYFTIDGFIPKISLIYPTNTTYTSAVTQLNYTRSDTNLFSCWYSTDSGVTNSSPDSTCANFTGLSADEGSNTWRVWVNDSVNHQNSSSITFTKDTTAPETNFYSPANATTSNSLNQTFMFNFTDNSGLKNSTLYIWNSTGSNLCLRAWDLSSASYDNVNISIQDATPTDLFFKSDGSRLYEIGSDGDKIYQYTCSTPWLLSSCTYDSISISTQDSFPSSLFFKSDGSRLYEIGYSGNKVYQYTCSTPWLLSSCTYDSLYVSSQDLFSTGIFFNSDGINLYIIGYNGDKIYQYSCSSAWDINTCSYSSIYMSTQSGSPHGLFFKSDGTKLYELGYEGKIYQYSLNHTTVILSGTSNSTSWTYNFSDYDTYNWNAYTCDQVENCAFNSTNYTIIISNVTSINLAQSLSISDIQDRVSHGYRKSSDSFTISNAIKRLFSPIRKLVDIIIHNSFVSRLTSVQRLFNLETTFNNIASRISSFKRGLADSFSLSNVAKRLFSPIRAIADTITLGSSSSRLTKMERLFNQENILNNVALRFSSFKRLFNQQTIIDSFSLRLIGFKKLFNQVITLGSSNSRLSQMERLFKQTFSLNNVNLRMDLFKRGLADSFSISSARTRTINFFRISNLEIILNNATDRFFSIIRHIIQTIIFTITGKTDVSLYLSYNPSTDADLSAVSRNWVLVNVSSHSPRPDTTEFSWMDMNGTFATNVGDNYWSNKSGLGDGNYTFYAWNNDTDGDYNFTATRIVTVDTTSPTISIITPATLSTYNNATGIPLNFTKSDATALTCFYTVIDESLTTLINNASILECSNTTFNLTDSGSYEITLYAQDLAGNLASDSNVFRISVEVPAVTLNIPLDDSYSQGQNVNFSFTASDYDGIDYCDLYSNFTGIWQSNETFNFIISGIQKSTLKNITEEYYIWNVNCIDTTGLSDSALSNFTLNVDTTVPNVTISNLNNSQVLGQIFTLSYNITDDRSLDSCYFTLKDSDGNLNNYGANTSLNCSANSRSLTTLTVGTFILNAWGEDTAGNLNVTQIYIQTTSVSVPSGGGVPLIGLEKAVNFSIQTLNFKDRMDITIAVDTTKPRKKQFYLINEGLETIKVKVGCNTEEVNQSSKDANICDYVLFPIETFDVPPNVQNPVIGTVLIDSPSDTDYGDNYFFNIVAVRGNSQYDKLSTKAQASALGIFYKWKYIPFFEDKTSYPVFLVALLFSALAFVGSLLIFSKFKKAQLILRFFVSLGIFITLFVVLIILM